jgi:large repetitive protein
VSVWQVGESFADSANAEYPSMSIAADGTLYGAWTNYATSSAYYGTTAGNTPIFYMYDPAEYSDLYVDPTTDSLNMVFLGNYYGGNGWDASIATGGAISVWNDDVDYPGITTEADPDNGWWQTDAPGSGGYAPPFQADRNGNYNYFHRGEMLYHDEMLLQFRRPKIVREDGTNNIHVAYYDNDTRSAKYALFTATNTDPAEQPWVNLDGGDDGEDTQIVTNGGRSTAAGEYVSVQLDEAGRPVVAYYDITNSTLKLARATTTTPTTAADWQLQSVFIPDDPNRTFVGTYVDMKIDSTGNIHLVAYRTSTGALVYLYAADVDGDTDYVFEYSEIVDSEGAVGAWADLSLDESGGTAVPHVSYLNGSALGTFDGLKLARFDPIAGIWEHETVPVTSAVINDRTSIEYRRGAVTWDVAIGYKSTSFDIVRKLPEE